MYLVSFDENHIFNKGGSIAIENWEELKEMERKLNWIDKKCQNLNWFDVQIFKIYYLNGFSLTSTFFYINNIFSLHSNSAAEVIP